MSQRLAGALLVLMLGAILGVGLGIAAPALAVEATEGAPQESGPAPSIDEIGTHNAVSNQFYPEEQEPPAFFRFIYYPLVIAGVIVALLLVFAYLLWQPRFAEERRSRRRR